MKKVILKILIVLTVLTAFLMNIAATAAIAAVSLNIDAKSCVLVDSASGQVLYEQNPGTLHLYPASTTKIMTAIIALENGDLNRVMTAGSSAVNDIGKDGMNIGIMAGEQLKLEDLLNALLISSANETANIIAENICGTRDGFVALMNKKAQEIGAVNTHFVNPCGSHDENHYTTAGDLAKIARYAMSIRKFREIVAKKSYILPPTNKHSSWNSLYTTNKILMRTPNELFDITGVKTGFTVPAGYNLAASAINSEGMELISVIMGEMDFVNTDKIFQYTEGLLEYGFKNFALQNIDQPGRLVKRVPVVDAGHNAQLDLVTKSGLRAVMPLGESVWNLEKDVHVDTVKAPVKKGDLAGYIEYKNNGALLGKVDIIASESIGRSFQAKVAYFFKGSPVNTIFKRVVTDVLAVLVFLFILRFILRKISKRIRKLRSRRY